MEDLGNTWELPVLFQWHLRKCLGRGTDFKPRLNSQLDNQFWYQTIKSTVVHELEEKIDISIPTLQSIIQHFGFDSLFNGSDIKIIPNKIFPEVAAGIKKEPGRSRKFGW